MSKIFAKTMALTMFVLPIDCNDHVEPASYLQRPQNDSPIHDAARKGDVATLTKLLDTGLQSCNMQRLVFEAHQACVQAVPNNFEGYEWPPLHDAVFAGHIEAASLLLQRGAAVNAKSRNFGSTALHWAAYAGQLDAALLLLGDPWNADYNVRNNAGQTAMRAAPTADFLKIMRAWNLPM